MEINTRQSRQGSHIQSVYVDSEYVGVIKIHRTGGLIAIRKSDGEKSAVLFATVDDAAEWLVGDV